MLEHLKRFFSSERANRGRPSEEASAVAEKGIAIHGDRPIEHISDDLLDRAALARQIAKIVATRGDASSLVIGLYGPWGDGKTSTLSMIKECLKVNSDVITMDYNPWFYGDSTEALTRSFFASIKVKLETSGFFSRENIGGLMADYGKSIPYVGDAVERAGEVITTEALTDTRDKLGAILRKHGKKVVIFIDDIDRLDRSEIQTLFKLVRLSGGFDHTTYVLAFDDGVIADALGEAYGSSGSVAGRRFLEKIVQVPLHLPPAKPEKLRELMFAACDRVLAQNEYEFAEGEGSELGNALGSAFVHALKTPRQVKLFENAISFAVPLLKGEVRVIEQIQIEALRVFYPSVYDVVRKNPEILLRAREGDRDEQRPSPIDIAILGIEGDEDEKAAIRDLLVGLFPRFGTMGYGHDWERTWSEQKRICSRDYFHRYFTYAVPTGDMSDLLIDDLVVRASDGDGAAVGAMIEAAYQRGAAELLIRKLRSRESFVALDAVPTLIVEISARTSAIPISRDLFLSDFVLSQAAILIVKLAARVEAAQQDEWLAASAEGANSLLFVSHLIHQSRADEGSHADSTSLPPERIDRLAAILLRRIRQAAEDQNLFDGVGDQLGKIVYTIRAGGSEETVRELRDYLSGLLAADVSNAVRFIKAFAGRSQGGDGVIRVSDITRDTYGAISEILDPERIYEGLRAQYGEEIADSKWREAEDDARDLDRRVANQFAYLHLHPQKPEEESKPD